MTHNPPVSTGNAGSSPESGRFLGGENGKTLQCSCLENSRDRGLQSMESQIAGHDSAGTYICTY